MPNSQWNSKRITNALLTASAAILLFGSGYSLGEYKILNSKQDRLGYSVYNANVPSDKKIKDVNFSLFWNTNTIIHIDFHANFIQRKFFPVGIHAKRNGRTRR